MTGENPAETLASPPVSETASAPADHVSAQIMSSSTHPKPADTDSVAVHGHGTDGFWALAIGSIGVVFGDIGTSPLYAMKEALIYANKHGISPEQQIMGLISLVFWALIMIVTVKYVLFLMRADNKGEGGTLALMALAQKALGKYSPTVFFLGICGAALFYGDGIITPAVSVLGAVEGLKDAPGVGHTMSHLIVPISAVILLGLFLVQSKGTANVARFFGPITVIWFLALGLLGLWHIRDHVDIVKSLMPQYAVELVVRLGGFGIFAAFLVLGSIFLAVIERKERYY